MNTLADIFSDPQLHPVEGEAPTPLYFRLYRLLKNAILDGTLSEGTRMPTEQELSEYFGVSRITAKRAMDELAAEDLVARQRGRGSHVIYQYQPQPVKAPLMGMLEEIESMARHSEVKVLECKRLLPPARIRELLGLQAEDKALLLERIRYRDRQAFAYYSSWTTGLSKPVNRRQFSRSPRLEIFRKQGLQISHITQTISAVAASVEQADHLDTEVGAPLLSLQRHSFAQLDGKERLVDVLDVFYHPERFQYRMELQPDQD